MTETAISRAVLITGCSTGIGRATACRLAAHGWTVYATARRPDTIADLTRHGCRTLRLDVTDEESMRQAVVAVEDAEDAVGVLVNNAGYGLEGAVEEVQMSDVRRQFETNVIGPTRLTQLVLPGMRRQHWGRIVNISSLGGRMTMPGGGFYHASKHALEAISDALRFELAGFGIDVVVVEPGATRTRWFDTATAPLDKTDEHSPYAAFHTSVADQLRMAQAGLLARFSANPDAAAGVIEQAISTDHPHSRYVVPRSARTFLVVRRLLPDRAWDALMRSRFASPGASAPAGRT